MSVTFVSKILFALNGVNLDPIQNSYSYSHIKNTTDKMGTKN